MSALSANADQFVTPVNTGTNVQLGRIAQNVGEYGALLETLLAEQRQIRIQQELMLTKIYDLDRTYSGVPSGHRSILVWVAQHGVRQSTTWTLPLSSVAVADTSRDRGVPLPVVVQAGALFVAALSGASLAIWLVGSSAPISPFMSFLALVASPFFYAMGAIAKRELKGSAK